ncbi:hypothetical protein [Nocardioides ochotonae]|uniref:hypothetical protein n=1 Tax=Nocardioides ochotonae TaxID=2685869 RepID=UPI00140804F2|nr:hypothetical protein [Nocardioides ochotonae]
MPKPPLRAVAADEKPAPPPKPKTLVEAVAAGSYLEILEAQQREMAVEVKETSGPAKAAMYRQIALISKEIEALRVAAKEEAAENGEGVPDDEEFDVSAV